LTLADAICYLSSNPESRKQRGGINKGKLMDAELHRRLVARHRNAEEYKSSMQFLAHHILPETCCRSPETSSNPRPSGSSKRHFHFYKARNAASQISNKLTLL
jgi:hypothetical protein